MSAPSLPASTLIDILATKPDLVPSIVFTIAYSLLIPLAIWRGVSQFSRTPILIRPTIFILVRIGTFIVRALEANGNYSVGIIATELVLLTVGTVLLLEPLIELIKRLLGAHIPYNGPMNRDRKGRLRRKDEVGTLSRVLKIALIILVVLSIYTSTKINGAFKDAGTAHTVATLRKLVAAIFVGISALCVLGLVYFHIKYTLATGPFYLLLVVGLLLEVTSAYRLASALGDARNHLVFWLASALPEWLVTATYFTINLHTFIPPAPQTQPEFVPLGRAQPSYQYTHAPPPARDHV